jgi:hypothetical protein
MYFKNIKTMNVFKKIFSKTTKCSYMSISEGAAHTEESSVTHARINNQHVFYNI